MKYGFIFLLILILFPFNVWAEDSDSGEAFLEASKRLPVAERIERARKIISKFNEKTLQVRVLSKQMSVRV